MWIETIRQACPSVCQKTDYKFAVPAGIHPRATKARGTESVYYVCATHFAGWRVGYNINYIDDLCYSDYRQAIYGESYYCLCSDKPVPPISKINFK